MAAVVSLSGETATVTVTVPGTGEVLRGRLEPAADRRPSGQTWDALGGSAVSRGPGGPSGASLLAAGPRTLHLEGNLVGDEGTTLHCEVALEQRVRVRGEGVCEVVGEGPPARYILLF